MAKLELFNQEGKKLPEVEVSAAIFAGPVRKPLLWEMIKMQQANARQGNAATKTRGMVQGSTRKIYRQKGTGNARHGDIKAPIFVGGGKVFGPHPRDYSYRMSRKARQSALKAALTLKYKEGNFKVVDKFSLKEIKTKKALEIFNKLNAQNALLVIDQKDPIVEKSIRNLPHHKVLRVDGINVLDLVKYDQLICTAEALKKIEARLQ